MALTLGALTLPADLVWTDEFEWFTRVRAIEQSVTGVPVIQETTLVAGRPITLTDDNAWLTRAELLDLVDLANTADTTHTLTLHDAREFDVQFREPPIQASQVIAYADPSVADMYRLTINLITV